MERSGTFQSSAAPKDGCNGPQQQQPSPTPVSILSRPEGRLQLYPSGVTITSNSFQSSAAPKDGCNTWEAWRDHRFIGFQSSAAPKDGCNVVVPSPFAVPSMFQSSAAPKDGCNT